MREIVEKPMAPPARQDDAPTGAPPRVVPVRLPDATAGQRRWLVVEAPPRLLVPRRLQQAGLAGYEPEAMACFLAALDSVGDGAVWDIGANVGVYGLVARALTGRAVRGFEAVPDLASLASTIAAANGLAYPVDDLALGAEPGVATLYLSDRSDTSNSLAEGFRPSSTSLSVPVETVDAIAAKTGECPIVIKVDTETTEPEVLRGAAKTVAEHRPWILCEVLARPYCGPALMDAIASWGYHWYHLAGEFPLAPAAEIRGDNDAMMWLLAPEPLPEAFWDAAQRWRDRLAVCVPVEPATEVADLQREVRKARNSTKKAERRLAALNDSATMEAGRIVRDVARRPVRGGLEAPGRALRLWRSRRDR
jgi:FkbM family methyltransferase